MRIIERQGIYIYRERVGENRKEGERYRDRYGETNGERER